MWFHVVGICVTNQIKYKNEYIIYNNSGHPFDKTETVWIKDIKAYWNHPWLSHFNSLRIINRVRVTRSCWKWKWLKWEWLMLTGMLTIDECFKNWDMCVPSPDVTHPFPQAAQEKPDKFTFLSVYECV